METGKVSGRYRALARSLYPADRIPVQRGGGHGAGAVRGERGPLSFNDGGGGGVLSGGVMVQKTIIFLYARQPELSLPSFLLFFLYMAPTGCPTDDTRQKNYC